MAYKEAIRLKPDYVRRSTTSAPPTNKLGNYEEAMGVFKEGSRTQPDFPEAQYNLGIAYYNRGQFNEAVSALQQLCA